MKRRLITTIVMIFICINLVVKYKLLIISHKTRFWLISLLSYVN